MAVIEAGKDAWAAMYEDQREYVNEAVERGRALSIATRVDRALEKYSTPGVPAIVPNTRIWKCQGDCEGSCCNNVNFRAFINMSDYEVLQWLCNHELMDLECN